MSESAINRDILSSPRGIAALWFSVLAGPLAWAAMETIEWMMVPWACATGLIWYLYLITLVALLFPAAAGYAAWRMWHEAGAELEAEEGGSMGRTRGMALGGMILSGMFILAIIAEAIPTFILGACQ